MVMTPKRRVMMALEHREPDRVPLGEIIVECDMVEQVLGHESFLRGHFKTDRAYWEGHRDEVVDSLKRDTGREWITGAIFPVLRGQGENRQRQGRQREQSVSGHEKSSRSG